MATQARIGSLISGRLTAGRWAQTSLRFLAARRTYAAPVHDFEKYNPEVVERDWYEWWQRRGLFQPKQGDDASSAGRFSMLLPPPNVTGILHIGHALTLSIQDAMARWNRMHGRSVNWVPGTDHAGISMQSVVEKKLKRETGQTRHDLGRSAFIAEVWKWKQEHSSHIKDQTMRIGASLNWDAEFFTMDAQHSQVVSEAFIRLYDAGLIYRATKMVNWSCALQSVISDIEVDKHPTDGRVLLQVPGSDTRVEFGVLHAIEFPIIDPPSGGPRMLRVETTRPETMLGDVALAIGSGDARYKGLAGRMVLHPLLNREVPIICDDELVDPAFGTGVVKVFGPDGTVVRSAHFGAFAGKSRWEMRAAVVDALVAAGAYAGKRDAEQSVVSRCSRSGDIIEPMLMPQWYLRCGEMAQRANDLVATGLIELLPAQQRASWHRWMSGIEDWCVSRQLWWGHRIPVYRVSWSAGGIRDVWVAAESSDQAKAKALARLSAAERAEIPSADEDAIGAVHQDEDVLDTWFSSALLPLTTFNYSSEHKTALAPPRHADGAGISGGGGGGGGGDNSNSSSRALSSVLETGQDILFFWVARMAMLCTHFSQVPPFEKVLLHPMVRDSQGRKMSKSLGNIIDPMDVINGAGLAKLEETLTRGHLSEQELSRSVRELKRLYPQGLQRFGADALRLTLLLYTQQTQQINMSLDSVKASYHFCNKLWNTFRFVHAHAARLGIQTSNADIGTGADTEYSPVWLLGIDSAQLTVFDRALLSKLWGMLQTYHNAMDTCRIAAAAETVREFVQRELCDRYIEVSKLALFGKTNATRQDPSVAAKILLGTLDIVLRALHPFMPFLSEASVGAQ